MQLRKFEFWLISGCVLFYVLFLVYEGVGSSGTGFEDIYLHRLGDFELPFDYYKQLLLPRMIQVTACYPVFLLLNYRTFPQLQKQPRNFYGFATIGAAALVLFAVFYTANYFSLHHYYQTFRTRRGAQITWAKLAFAYTLLVGFAMVAYYLLKVMLRWIYEVHLANKPAEQHVMREVTVAAMLWLAICISVANASYGYVGTPFFVVAYQFLVCIIFFFLWVYKYIPSFLLLKKKRKIILPSLLLFILIQIPFLIYAASSRLRHSEEIFTLICISVVVALIAIVWPAANYYYTLRKNRSSTITTLQTAVSTSSANLDFLRSQINPHFLFNALNTIYGTALQENAEKTAEGIQKLGDMMRFMLKEKQHEKIALQQEITYLQNYIDLQKLRTEQSPDIDINFTAQEDYCDHEIAPMLLIPFVENAFKHGISLNEKSWIRISLYCDESHVFFDVYNSIHLKNETDPEKDRSGIGLENVQQRLTLLYPQQHELNIRQTSNEYFVHLTISV